MGEITDWKSSHTVTYKADNVWDLFEKVYAQATDRVISVYIDVLNLTATITYNMEVTPVTKP